MSSRLEEQSKESEAVHRENFKLKEKIVQIGDFSQDMERVFKEQVQKMKIMICRSLCIKLKIDEVKRSTDRIFEVTIK